MDLLNVLKSSNVLERPYQPFSTTFSALVLLNVEDACRPETQIKLFIGGQRWNRDSVDKGLTCVSLAQTDNGPLTDFVKWLQGGSGAKRKERKVNGLWVTAPNKLESQANAEVKEIAIFKFYL